MTARTEYTLVDPRTKNLAFSIFLFDDGKYFQQVRNFGYYSLVLVQEGSGKFQADVTEYEFAAKCLLAFSVHQPFRIKPNTGIKGVLIHFHPDFFCIHKHHEEVACNGVLFNNAYETPLVDLDLDSTAGLLSVIESLRTEMQDPAVAQYELLVSYLKIFLIKASRIKMTGREKETEREKTQEPFILQTLKDAIEEHFRSKHSPGEYALLLNITTNSLNRLSKTFFKRTLTGLIAERIMIEAKRELYLTSKSVKIIAYELGFNDEFYFSRWFKNNAAVSPQAYRESVGFDRGGT